MRPIFAVLLLAVAAMPAHAGTPPLIPARDVDIVYRVVGRDGTSMAEQRVRWDVAGQRQRIDPPTPGLHVIIDLRSHHVESVRDAEKLALEIDPPAPRPQPNDLASIGQDKVAGLDCTIWRAKTDPELCFTADGVLLRVVVGGRPVAEAVRVTYTPSNPADFTVPQDYRRIVPGQDTPKDSTP